MSASKPVAVIMGSQSDWAVMRRAAETLEALGVGYDACIVSAIHRLHLLPRFDMVVLLDAGRIVDAGTYEELLERQPRFRAALRPLDSVA